MTQIKGYTRRSPSGKLIRVKGYTRNDSAFRFRRSESRVLKNVKRQTGKTNRKVDSKRRALHPGKRLSKSGNTYYETRKNRSDLDYRKKL